MTAGSRGRQLAAYTVTAVCALASVATSEPRVEVKIPLEHRLVLSEEHPKLKFRFTAFSSRRFDLNVGATGRWRGEGPPTPVMVRMLPDDTTQPKLERRIFVDRDAPSGSVPQGMMSDLVSLNCRPCVAHYTVELSLDGQARKVEIDWSTEIRSDVGEGEESKVGIQLEIP